jgi:hypothetical protein
VRRSKKGVVFFPSIAHQAMEPSKGDQIGIFFHFLSFPFIEKGESRSFGVLFPWI